MRRRRPAAPAKEVSVEETLLVECLVPGGRGLARMSDGRIAFASGTAPGDEIRVERAVDKGSFVDVHEWRLHLASSKRLEPECVFARSCGGCDWMHLTTEAARTSKMHLLTQALRRTGGFRELPVTVDWVPSARATRYRLRIRLHLSKGRIGFLSAQSHELVEIDSCLIASEPLNGALGALRRALQQDPPAFAPWSQVELQVRPESPESAWVHLIAEARLSAEEASTEERRSLDRGAARRDAGKRSAVRARTEAVAPARIVALHRVQTLLGHDFVVSADEQQAPWERQQVDDELWVALRPGAFSQVNGGINQALIRLVCEWAERMQAGSFLDLYCGNGNFSLPLLARGLDGVGVESSGTSLELARRAERVQRATGWGKAEFLEGDCVERAAQLTGKGPFDLVVVDPPRVGAHGIVPHLRRLVGKVLLMVSCDPVTLARDLGALAAQGFQLEAISACDMFPQTHHLETCVVLLPPG